MNDSFDLMFEMRSALDIIGKGFHMYKESII
jgi:hypothetical protein